MEEGPTRLVGGLDVGGVGEGKSRTDFQMGAWGILVNGGTSHERETTSRGMSLGVEIKSWVWAWHLSTILQDLITNLGLLEGRGCAFFFFLTSVFSILLSTGPHKQ